MTKKKYISTIKNLDENKLYLHKSVKNGKRGQTGPANSSNIYLSNINNNSILYKNNNGLTGSNNLTYNPSGLGKITFPGIFDPLGIVMNPSINDINISNSIWLKNNILHLSENPIIDSNTINNYLIGQTGSTGMIGSMGNIGFDGNIGLIGITGLTGPTGITGSIGIIGNIGSYGFEGDNGLTGSIGNIGANGPIGHTGMQGSPSFSISNLTGPTGLNGNTGQTGPIASFSGDVLGMPSNNTINTIGSISSSNISNNINKLINSTSVNSNNTLSQRDNNGGINYSNIAANQIKLNNTTLISSSGVLNTISLPNISDNLISNISGNILVNKTINDNSNYISTNTLKNGNIYNVSLGGNFPSNNQLLTYNGSSVSWNTFSSGNNISAVILQKLAQSYGPYTTVPWEKLDLNNIVNPLNVTWISDLSSGIFTLQPGIYDFTGFMNTFLLNYSHLAIYSHTTNSFISYYCLKREINQSQPTSNKLLFLNTIIQLTSLHRLSLQVHTYSNAFQQHITNFGYIKDPEILNIIPGNNGIFVSLQIIKLV